MMTENIGTYGTDYLQRACAELIGLGANLPEEAIYPLGYLDADGQPFTGKHRYVWHLAPKDLPPVNAFWSLTLYDAEGFQVANDLTGSRSATATTWHSTTTARSTSTSRTTGPAAAPPIGSRPPRAGSTCVPASTIRNPKRSTAPGHRQR
jgi:hypothetical protein